MEEIGGVEGVPLAVAVVEVELHEVARDGGDEHVAGPPATASPRATGSPTRTWPPWHC